MKVKEIPRAINDEQSEDTDKIAPHNKVGRKIKQKTQHRNRKRRGIPLKSGGEPKCSRKVNSTNCFTNCRKC